MSVSSEILRIQTATNTLKSKGVNLGISLSTDKLDTLAEKFDENLVNQGSVSASVQEGETYNIPAGYHNGSGTVSGIAGGGNYTLESRTVTPTKATQAIVSGDGYYGLSDVTVNPIPDAYQDVTSVTATAENVLANKLIVDSDGEIVAGTMANNGAVATTLNTTTTSYTVPAGYHSGSGTVSITLEDEAVTPTTAEQVIEPTTGKVLSSVTVSAIPTNYKDTTTTDAVAANILAGKKAATGDGIITGTMTNNGSVVETLDVDTTSVAIAAGYHDGTGSISITVEDVDVTPSTSEQVIEPTSGSVLGSVTVDAIPSNYQDTTNATATAADLLSGVKAVTSAGTITGSMTNNGAVTASIDGLTISYYTIPAGYHNGSGTVSLSDDIEEALASI